MLTALCSDNDWPQLLTLHCFNVLFFSLETFGSSFHWPPLSYIISHPIRANAHSVQSNRSLSTHAPIYTQALVNQAPILGTRVNQPRPNLQLTFECTPWHRAASLPPWSFVCLSSTAHMLQSSWSWESEPGSHWFTADWVTIKFLGP